ncbi:MAG: GNAT family N-acetyltransferase [Actinomycetota bacterium]
MPSPITIRALAADDESHWRRLWTGYLDYYETTVTDDVYDSTFARLLDPENHAQQALLAIDAEDAPVGLVHFIFHPHNWRIEQVTYLQDLFVDPELRGTGVGRALIEAVYAAADENGTPSVYWLTQDFNEAGRRLYDKVAKVTPFIMYRR